MQVWKVTTPSGQQNVTAMHATTTSVGDLVLKRQDGELLFAFAKNSWLTCELVKAIDSGYGHK